MKGTKIFLSWSGPTSHRLANVFEDWVEANFKIVAFCSSSDIAAGDSWNNTVRKELRSSKLGLLFIVHKNSTNPWLLFEAGALLGNNSAENRSAFIPLLFGLAPKELVGPLNHFHGLEFNKKSIWKILTRINAIENLNNLDELERNFEEAWPALEREIHQVMLEDEYEANFRGLTSEQKLLFFLQSFASGAKITFYKPREGEMFLGEILISIIKTIIVTDVDSPGIKKREAFKKAFFNRLNEWLESKNPNLVLFASEIIGYFKIDDEDFEDRLLMIFQDLDENKKWKGYQLNCLWAFSRIQGYSKMNEMLKSTKNDHNREWIMVAYAQMIKNKDNNSGDDLESELSKTEMHEIKMISSSTRNKVALKISQAYKIVTGEL